MVGNNADSGSELASTVIVNAIIFFALIIIFTILRQIFKRFYAPYCYDTCVPSTARPIDPDYVHGGKRIFYFQWVWFTLRYPKENLQTRRGGFDSVIFLLFLKHLVILFLILTLVICTLLLPVYAVGHNRYLDPDNPEFVSSLDIVALSNIQYGSHLLWATIVGVYILTFITLYSLYRFMLQARLYTHKYLSRPDLIRRTVMISHLSKDVTDEEVLRGKFNTYYGLERVEDATLAYQANKLRQLLKQRSKLEEKWKDAQYSLQDSGKEPRTRTGKIPCVGKKVDSIPYFEEEIAKLDKQISELQSAPQESFKQSIQQSRELSFVSKFKDHFKPTRVGFVTFDSLSTAHQCNQSLLSQNPSRMKTEIAPEMSDVYWKYLSVGPLSRDIRLVLVIIALVVLFFFWGIPVTFIASITTLDSLSQFPAFDFLTGFVESNPLLLGLVENFLPSLALIIFMALLPIILRMILQRRAFYLRSNLERAIFITYWTFLLLNVVLVVTIAGSLFTVLYDIADQPASVVNLLANSLPAQQNFFIAFILTHIAVSLCLSLIRPVPFIIYLILRSFSKHKRPERIIRISDYSFTTTLANHLVIFTIGIIYSCLAPIVLPVTFLYFLFAYIATKYNLIFAFYRPRFEGSALKLALASITITIIALIISQLTLIGVLALKRFPYAAILAPAVGITVLFCFWLHRYYRTISSLPLSKCPHPTKIESIEIPVEEGEDEIDTLERYIDPALIPPPSLTSFNVNNTETKSLKDRGS